MFEAQKLLRISRTMAHAFVLFLFLLTSVFAQKKDFALPPVDRKPEEVVHGDLFTVRVTPGAKTTTFFLVGKKSAELEMANRKLRIVTPSGTRELRMVSPGQFVYDQPIKDNVKMIVVDPQGATQETLELKLTP